jgi:hypothetical protein
VWLDFHTWEQVGGWGWKMVVVVGGKNEANINCVMQLMLD